MSHTQESLERHLLSLNQYFGIELTAEQLLAQLNNHLTLSSEDGVLCLFDRENPLSKLKVDFIHGALSYRSQQHLGAENLIKACQIKGRKTISLLDGTCGLGTDSFLLHQAGFQVTAVEKNAIIYALLLDGMFRYQQHSNQQGFSLQLGDVAAGQWLEAQHDVVYLDPMFPEKPKSAKNKKTMQLFQTIHQSAADDAAQLLEQALASCCDRVVVKRPTKSPLLTKFKPTFQLLGKTCRFDAYQIR